MWRVYGRIHSHKLGRHAKVKIIRCGSQICNNVLVPYCDMKEIFILRVREICMGESILHATCTTPIILCKSTCAIRLDHGEEVTRPTGISAGTLFVCGCVIHPNSGHLGVHCGPAGKHGKCGPYPREAGHLACLTWQLCKLHDSKQGHY